MTQTITLPDLWLMVAPCGCLDGYVRSVSTSRPSYETAEAAWKAFYPRKRERDKEQRLGFTIRGGDFTEWNEREPKECQHVPQWGIPAISTSTEEP